MNQLTDEQFQKITLLDKLLGSLSVEQLKELSESEQIVSRLKGTEDTTRILATLLLEHNTLMLDYVNRQVEFQSLKSDFQSLKSDFQSLVKVLHADVFTPRYNQDFNNLKSRHNIY